MLAIGCGQGFQLGQIAIADTKSGDRDSFSRVGVDFDQRAAKPRFAVGHFELGWVRSEPGFHHPIDPSSDDTFRGSGHADVALKRGALGQQAFIGRCHVGMGAEYGRDFAVEIAAHQLCFAGGLGVKIEEPNFHVGRDLIQHPIGGAKGAVDRIHVELS